MKKQRSSTGVKSSYELTGESPTLQDITNAHGKGLGFQSLTRSYLRSLRSSNNEGLPTTGPPARTDSSERGLRKSKSMFTSFGRSDNDPYDAVPLTLPEDIYRNRSRYASLNLSHDKPFKTSTSGDNGSIDNSRRDLAIKLAREKFQAQVEHQKQKQHQHLSLKSQPSFFFKSRSKRSESSMGLRRSLRNSSNSSAPLSSAFSGQSLAIGKSSMLRNTARRVSQSIRSKMRGVFGGQRDPECVDNFPTDLGEHYESPDAGVLRKVDYEETSVNQVVSRTPFLHPVSSSQQMKSRKGSVESICEDEGQMTDDKSRVTSWTNSVSNTMTSHCTAGEWERQRLSVIKENGTHVSSSSLPRNLSNLEAGSIVSSDRVYAALMSKLEKNKQQDEETRQRSMDDFKTRGITPLRSSSAEPYEVPTIRCVPSEDNVFHQYMHRTNSGFESNAIAPTSKPQSVYDPSSVSSRDSPVSIASKTVPHRSSAFFGTPSSHLFRTASPYRRALQNHIAQANEPPRGSTSEAGYLTLQSPLVLPPRTSSVVGSEKETAGDWEHSSTRGTSGHGVLEENSIPESDLFPRPPDHTRRHLSPTTPNRECTNLPVRNTSTASSVEWKRWLSADVSKLERSEENQQRLGHVREEAEIDSPEERHKAGPGTNIATPHGGSPLRVISSNSRSASVHKQVDAEKLIFRGTENQRYLVKPPHQYYRPSNLLTSPPSSLMPLTSNHAFAHGLMNEDNEEIPSSARAWPLADSPRSASSLPMNPSGIQRRSRLDQIMKSPHEDAYALDPPEPPYIKRPSTASPFQRTTGKIERTLDRLHLRDGSTGQGSVDGSSQGLEPSTQVMGSKKMVDLFLGSRRRKSKGIRSSSTSESSAVAFL